MEILETFTSNNWQYPYAASDQQRAIAALEEGKILLLPQLAFTLSAEELALATPRYVSPKTKNISYDVHTDELRGSQGSEQENAALKKLLHRYCDYTNTLLYELLPAYQRDLIVARTSLRPSSIANQNNSYRKDDTRLHVDAFPSTPTGGLRILRVFTNINAHGQERVWRVGEAFRKVAEQFAKQLRQPIPGELPLLHMLKITRKQRSPYDHFMLQLHNTMKADTHYQQRAQQQELRLMPGSSWVVFTDQVSHAAMSGQNMLEQSFYLPVKAMSEPAQSPLRTLENILGRALV